MCVCVFRISHCRVGVATEMSDDVVPIPEVIVHSVESSLVHVDLYEPCTRWELHPLYRNRFSRMMSMLADIQWDPSNPDTQWGRKKSEVSSFQRVKCMQEWYILGVGKGVLFREVPLYVGSGH